MTPFAIGFLCGCLLILTRQESSEDHFKAMLDSFPWSKPTD